MSMEDFRSWGRQNRRHHHRSPNSSRICLQLLYLYLKPMIKAFWLFCGTTGMKTWRCTTAFDASCSSVALPNHSFVHAIPASCICSAHSAVASFCHKASGPSTGAYCVLPALSGVERICFSFDALTCASLASVLIVSAFFALLL